MSARLSIGLILSRCAFGRPACRPPINEAILKKRNRCCLGLLAGSRSVHAAQQALVKMGLSSARQDLETVATRLVEELELHNSRPLDPDLLALLVDGKYIELCEGDQLRSACIYLVIGLGRDGKKRS